MSTPPDYEKYGQHALCNILARLVEDHQIQGLLSAQKRTELKLAWIEMSGRVLKALSPPELRVVETEASS